MDRGTRDIECNPLGSRTSRDGQTPVLNEIAPQDKVLLVQALVQIIDELQVPRQFATLYRRSPTLWRNAYCALRWRLRARRSSMPAYRHASGRMPRDAHVISTRIAGCNSVWQMRNGGAPLPGKRAPFFIPTQRAVVRLMLVPGVCMGRELHPGAKWCGYYFVADLSSFDELGFRPARLDDKVERAHRMK